VSKTTIGGVLGGVSAITGAAAVALGVTLDESLLTALGAIGGLIGQGIALFYVGKNAADDDPRIRGGRSPL
jgi:hypothetical protein